MSDIVPRSLKLKARSYSKEHGVGYQKALRIVDDPIRAVIESLTGGHHVVVNSRHSPHVWYQALIESERASSLAQHFVMTHMSVVSDMSHRRELMRLAAKNETLPSDANFWDLRRAERAHSLDSESLRYKEEIMCIPAAMQTPLIIRCHRAHSEVSERISKMVMEGGVHYGIMELYISHAGSRNLPRDVTPSLVSMMSDRNAAEWIRALFGITRDASPIVEMILSESSA